MALHVGLVQETLLIKRILSHSSLVVDDYDIRKPEFGLPLKYFVVSPVEFIIGKMRIALRDLNAGMPG